MKKYKFEIFMIVLILLISLILFGFALVMKVYDSNRSYTLFLDPLTVLDCVGFECENKIDDLDEYNNKNYSVYIDGNYEGENQVYYNKLNSKFYVFNQSNANIYKDKSNLFAYSGKTNIGYKDIVYGEVDEEDTYNISKLLDISYDINDAVISKISMDFDNDNKNENLFVVNVVNVVDEISNGESLLIYEDNAKYIILSSDKIDTNDYLSMTSVSKVIDIFNDGKLEFIHTKTYFDQIGSCNVVYRLKGKKFVKMNECEVNK